MHARGQGSRLGREECRGSKRCAALWAKFTIFRGAESAYDVHLMKTTTRVSVLQDRLWLLLSDGREAEGACRERISFVVMPGSARWPEPSALEGLWSAAVRSETLPCFDSFLFPRRQANLMMCFSSPGFFFEVGVSHDCLHRAS